MSKDNTNINDDTFSTRVLYDNLNKKNLNTNSNYDGNIVNNSPTFNSSRDINRIDSSNEDFSRVNDFSGFNEKNSTYNYSGSYGDSYNLEPNSSNNNYDYANPGFEKTTTLNSSDVISEQDNIKEINIEDNSSFGKGLLKFVLFLIFVFVFA